jgi:hypothetical protein
VYGAAGARVDGGNTVMKGEGRGARDEQDTPCCHTCPRRHKAVTTHCCASL